MINYTGDGVGLHIEDTPTYLKTTPAEKLYYMLCSLLKNKNTVIISVFKINRTALDNEVNIRVEVLDTGNYFDINKVGDNIDFYSERINDTKISIDSALTLIQELVNQSSFTQED